MVDENITPLRRVGYIRPGEYSIQTACGYLLRVKRDKYKGGWRIWNITGLEWGSETFQTKRDALKKICEAFSA